MSTEVPYDYLVSKAQMYTVQVCSPVHQDCKNKLIMIYVELMMAKYMLFYAGFNDAYCGIGILSIESKNPENILNTPFLIRTIYFRTDKSTQVWRNTLH